MEKLKWFNDILLEKLEEKRISLNQFSKEADIPYASVHRMLHGQQNISEKDLDKLLDTRYFFESELEELREYYRQHNITKEKGKPSSLYNICAVT